MVIKDRVQTDDRSMGYDLLKENGYPDGAPRREGFDENDDPYQSLPRMVARIDESWEQIHRLGLERNAVELLTLGYTAIAPERIGPPEFIEAYCDCQFRVWRTGSLCWGRGSSR